MKAMKAGLALAAVVAILLFLALYVYPRLTP